jgi:hypothetical protein
MRERFHTYSQVLQLNTETLLAFKYAPDGLMRGLQMFTVVALAAGLGLWLGIPVQLDRPVLYEELGSAQGVIDNLANSVEPFLAQNIPYLESPQELAGVIGEGAQAASDTVNELLLMAETEAEQLSPPLGPRVSRVIRLRHHRRVAAAGSGGHAGRKAAGRAGNAQPAFDGRAVSSRSPGAAPAKLYPLSGLDHAHYLRLCDQLVRQHHRSGRACLGSPDSDQRIGPGP